MYPRELSEQEKKMEAFYKEQTAKKISGKFYIMFYLLLVSTIISFVGEILSRASGSSNIYFIVSVLSSGINLVYGFLMATLPTPIPNDDRFKRGGIFYMLTIIFGFIYDPLLSSYSYGIIFQAVAAIFALLSFYNFVPAIREILCNYDFGLSDSWDKFKKVYTIILLSLLGAILICWIPIINLIAIIAIVIYSIGILIIPIWEIILVYKTHKSLSAFRAYFPNNNEAETE